MPEIRSLPNLDASNQISGFNKERTPLIRSSADPRTNVVICQYIENIAIRIDDPSDSNVEIRSFLFELSTNPVIDRDSFRPDNVAKVGWANFFIVPLASTHSNDKLKGTNSIENAYGSGGSDRLLVGRYDDATLPYDNLDGGAGSATLDFPKVGSGIYLTSRLKQYPADGVPIFDVA